ncbi:MAG: archaellin/type IV pilin N-terminal domain-containing protein [Candidatus Altiarchaeota archaeon]
MKPRRRGLVGLDTLILFIAILLAVSVAAYALISTTNTLSVRNQREVAEKSKNIQKPIIIESVRGLDNNDDKRMDELVFSMRLQESSEPINLNSTIVIINSRTLNCTSLEYEDGLSDGCHFTIFYGKRGRDYSYPYLNIGDLVEIHYNGSGIQPGVDDSHASMILLPPHGYGTNVKVDIPSRFYKRNTVIWPLKD